MSRLGYLLRSTGIDELPQLLSVVGGHISLCGPSPYSVDHDDEDARLIAKFAVRQHLKPGFTGPSQINRGTTQLARTEDLFYLSNWSFLLDLKIIVLTFLLNLPEH